MVSIYTVYKKYIVTRVSNGETLRLPTRKEITLCTVFLLQSHVFLSFKTLEPGTVIKFGQKKGGILKKNLLSPLKNENDFDQVNFTSSACQNNQFVAKIKNLLTLKNGSAAQKLWRREMIIRVRASEKIFRRNFVGTVSTFRRRKFFEAKSK